MSPQNDGLFAFGAFRLEPSERRLMREDAVVPLTPKAFDVLVVLVEHAGRLVSRDKLLGRVWPGTFVEEGNLTYTVSLVRKALGDETEPYRFIETVPKLGYRFIAPVTSADRFRSSPRSRRGKLALVAAVAVVLAALSALVVLRRSSNSTEAAAPARLDLRLPRGFVLDSGAAPALSPDGRLLAMVGSDDGRSRLWVRRLDATTVVALPGSEGASLPFWSPDSRRIGFFARGGMRLVEASGGPISTVVETSDMRLAPRGPASWGRGGQILFIRRDGRLHAVAETGGSTRPVTVVDTDSGERDHWAPSFLPDGQHFVFAVRGFKGSVIKVGSLDSQVSSVVLRGANSAVYSNGALLYLQGLALNRVGFDVSTFRVTTGPAPVAGLTTIRPSVSENGLVVVRTFHHRRRLTWYTQDGIRTSTVGDPGEFSQVEISPSGTRAAVVQSDETGNTDIWLVELSNGRAAKVDTGPTVLVSDLGGAADPAWSPDERRLAFTSRRSGAPRPATVDLATGEVSELETVDEPAFVDDWTSDGASIVFRAGWSLHAWPAEATRAPMRLADSTLNDQVQVSPDGRWVAYNSEASRQMEVYVARYPTFVDRLQISSGGGMQPRWRRDGTELYYLSLDGSVMGVPLSSRGTTLDIAEPRRIAARRGTPSDEIQEYDVAPDGRFLVLEPDETPESFTVLLNWLKN